MDKASYWQYLKNSLEIEDFLLPLTAAKTVFYNASATLGFFTDAKGFSSDEEKALFEKMVSAMGLGLNEVSLSLSQDPMDTSLPAKIRVVFVEQSPQMGCWQEVNGVRVFTTHSLTSLLQNPALKKSAWEHLKLVKAARH